jgi:uncharacterized protein (DUF58 family)
MSDFIDEKYEDKLRVMAGRHDVIGLKIYDKMDMTLPDIGMLKVEDLESGKTQWLNTSDTMVRHDYQQNFMQQSAQCKSIFKKTGADLLHIRTDEDYVKILQQFFLRRK